MRPLVTMRQALYDGDLFGRVLAGPSWDKWRALLLAICGERLTDEETVVYESLKRGHRARRLLRIARGCHEHRCAVCRETGVGGRSPRARRSHRGGRLA